MQLLDQCILQSEERWFIPQKFQMDRNWNLLVWVPQQELSDTDKYSQRKLCLGVNGRLASCDHFQWWLSLRQSYNSIYSRIRTKLPLLALFCIF